MTIVHFGAGNIGRGAIPEIFQGVYDQIVFIDLNQSLIDMINLQKTFTIKKSNPIIVKNFVGVYLNNFSAVAHSLQKADLISTSCGFENLEKIATIINQNNFSKKIPIVCFENNIRPSSYLKQFVQNQNSFEFIDCMIDRIVPKQKNQNLDVFVEDYLSIIIEKKHQFLNYFRNFEKVDNLDDYIILKLFGVNGLHYLIAILGFNQGYQFIDQVFSNPLINNFINSWIQALEFYLVENTNINSSFIKKFLKQNWQRFKNSALKDECSRIARNSILKLSYDNRIIPVIEMVLKSLNFDNDFKNFMIEILKQLYLYQNPLDADSVIIQKSIKEIGIFRTIYKFSKIKIN